MIPDLAVVPVVPVVSYKPSQAPQPNFLSEGVRLGLDKEIAPDGTYLAYFPFGAMIERSRMTPYHKKLLDALVILTSTSIYTNLITSIDEQRHLNDSASVYCSSLK